MPKRPLKRSLEYQSRVRHYAGNLAKRYRIEVADAFLARIEAAENFLYDKILQVLILHIYFPVNRQC